MKSEVTRLIVVCIVLSVAGCKTVYLDITSEPAGADVYQGSRKDAMYKMRGKTPLRSKATDIGAGWLARYYLARKTGFHDSEIIYEPETRGSRKVHFVLKAIGGNKEYRELVESGKIDNLEQIKRLVKQGGDVNYEEGGITALWRAAAKGRTEIVAFLLEAKADVNPISGRSALFIWGESIVCLPDWHCQSNDSCTVSGASALWIASWNGHADTVKLLLEAGADINRTARIVKATITRKVYDPVVQIDWVEGVLFEHITAVRVASMRRHTEIVELLKQYGAKE